MVGDIADKAETRKEGQLPSKTVGKATVSVVLRSGKEVVHDVPESSSSCDEEPQVETSKEAEKNKETVLERLNKGSEEEVVILPAPPLISQILPYPNKAKKQREKEEYRAFIEKLQEMSITIPLAEALRTIPSYSKFMKDYLNINTKVNSVEEQVCLTELSSRVLQGKLPAKLNDPGSFTIPCQIGEKDFCHALCDSVASISIMPFPYTTISD